MWANTHTYEIGAVIWNRFRDEDFGNNHKANQKWSWGLDAHVFHSKCYNLILKIRHIFENMGNNTS